MNDRLVTVGWDLLKDVFADLAQLRNSLKVRKQKTSDLELRIKIIEQMLWPKPK